MNAECSIKATAVLPAVGRCVLDAALATACATLALWLLFGTGGFLNWIAVMAADHPWAALPAAAFAWLAGIRVAAKANNLVARCGTPDRAQIRLRQMKAMAIAVAILGGLGGIFMLASVGTLTDTDVAQAMAAAIPEALANPKVAVIVGNTDSSVQVDAESGLLAVTTPAAPLSYGDTDLSACRAIGGEPPAGFSMTINGKPGKPSACTQRYNNRIVFRAKTDRQG